MNYFDLLLQATLFVKIVMGVLLGASFISWVVIFSKHSLFWVYQRDLAKFNRDFWSGLSLNQLYQKFSSQKSIEQSSGLQFIFRLGFQEYLKLLKINNNINSRHLSTYQLEDVQAAVWRAMSIGLNQEKRKLFTGLSFLATVQSISPYIGLFGTVWGIMHSFQVLGAVQQASLSMIAPGISEALIATAMGLVAAIPAGIAYNRYLQRVNYFTEDYQMFMTQFMNVLHRQTLCLSNETTSDLTTALA